MDFSIGIMFFLTFGCISSRKFKSSISVKNGSPWGNWDKPHYCPKGYAHAFQLKVQDYQGALSWEDDTGLNGIRLHCTDGTTIESTVGKWGTWQEIESCPKGNLQQFSLQVEEHQGIRDDTAANNIRFRCEFGVVLEGLGHNWGKFGDWSESCAPGFICGIITKMDIDQGIGDDTALNDVKFYCCY
ncbi:vitelline membrane outer layer protein 1-like [Hemicordylus capensis]|uniref:vitelline membrane outer layer protein 1-like n=1 Tax=Hemicordylus capensis TaxID=884348 RepID=UPI002303C001|nr:vitelline membrane outer layer protein 1-like [Hemicordylus capensis]XP_053160524.1 vitelline membrane outer layer protein 1-like [Hemicordylus capensis]